MPLRHGVRGRRACAVRPAAKARHVEAGIHEASHVAINQYLPSSAEIEKRPYRPSEISTPKNGACLLLRDSIMCWYCLRVGDAGGLLGQLGGGAIIAARPASSWYGILITRMEIRTPSNIDPQCERACCAAGEARSRAGAEGARSASTSSVSRNGEIALKAENKNLLIYSINYNEII